MGYAVNSIAEACRRESITAKLYYRWNKNFLVAGGVGPAGGTVREANGEQVVG